MAGTPFCNPAVSIIAKSPTEVEGVRPGLRTLAVDFTRVESSNGLVLPQTGHHGLRGFPCSFGGIWRALPRVVACACRRAFGNALQLSFLPASSTTNSSDVMTSALTGAKHFRSGDSSTGVTPPSQTHALLKRLRSVVRVWCRMGQPEPQLLASTPRRALLGDNIFLS